jgi:hypothetical protein
LIESLFPWLDPSHRSHAAIAAAGALTALLVFLMAWRSARRRRPSLLPPPPDGDALPAADAAQEPADRREVPRRSGALVGVYITGPEGALPTGGWVVDRSSRGMCVAVIQPVAAGTRLVLAAVDAPPKSPKADVLVKYCKRRQKYYYLGCQFVQELPWSVLLLFG